MPSVIELFAGVGGFRLGLEQAGWSTVFSNQWEPSTKRQHASEVYTARFGAEGHSNEDIAKVVAENISERRIPEADLLVGGFPCQDYSVAKSLNSSKGLEGKKGVLWWEIAKLIETNQPKMVFLENVDRLLKSPASQRGRDFAIMLSTLGGLGYSVEWRVINAAEYGFPQRRKRVFIVAKKVEASNVQAQQAAHELTKHGVLARAFPVLNDAEDLTIIETKISSDLIDVTENFKTARNISPFGNAGCFVDGVSYAATLTPQLAAIAPMRNVLVPEADVPESFFISEEKLPEWEYLKGAKQIPRVHKESGTEYLYSEGSMAFPDSVDSPARTILTGEGGSTASRFKHIIQTESGRHRRLMPIELERLNGFPDDWTRFGANGEEISDVRRSFFMGNALVVGLVEKVGKILLDDLHSAASG